MSWIIGKTDKLNGKKTFPKSWIKAGKFKNTDKKISLTDIGMGFFKAICRKKKKITKEAAHQIQNFIKKYLTGSLFRKIYKRQINGNIRAVSFVKRASKKKNTDQKIDFFLFFSIKSKKNIKEAKIKTVKRESFLPGTQDTA